MCKNARFCCFHALSRANKGRSREENKYLIWQQIWQNYFCPSLFSETTAP